MLFSCSVSYRASTSAPLFRQFPSTAFVNKSARCLSHTRSPGGVEVLRCWVVGQIGEARTVRVHHVDLASPASSVGSESYAGAIRRPRRGPVIVAGSVRQASPP